ncbi:hypothetical protein [Streptomyces sp. MB09-02B]|uniref:hypothetical protein n=1 Tax=Streptomyces sp. MB09-02B TaxID=3028667 RepID=UPI0039B0D66D
MLRHSQREQPGRPVRVLDQLQLQRRGQRIEETEHTSTGDTTTTYCYEKADQPHALTGTSTKADCTAPDRSYEFDSTGNTTSRPDGTATQDLDWSDEGRPATLTENDKTTEYLYGADGTLLIPRHRGR